MILLDDKLIADDLLEKQFACNVAICKGACCVKGDAGAPLLTTEINEISANLEKIKPFMDKLGIAILEKEGFYTGEKEGLETTCAPTGECVFVAYQNGIATCAIENAYEQNESTFIKPISCHLYPIRVSKVGEYTALNYHHWDICSPACTNGEKLGLPTYQFLKTALSRAFGDEFYTLLNEYALFKANNE